MFDYDRLSGVAPHPDGERLAYLSDAPGRPQPWLWHLSGSGEPRHLPVDGTVTRCVWRPDGSRLLVQADPDGAEDYRLAEIDPATGTVEWLTPDNGARNELGIPYGSIGNPYSPDGRLLAYASNARKRSCFDIMVRDLATGDVRTVLQAGDPLPEDRYFPMFFSPDSRRLLVLRLHQNTEQDLFAVELAGLSVEHVTPHDGRRSTCPPDGRPRASSCPPPRAVTTSASRCSRQAMACSGWTPRPPTSTAPPFPVTASGWSGASTRMASPPCTGATWPVVRSTSSTRCTDWRGRGGPGIRLRRPVAGVGQEHTAGGPSAAPPPPPKCGSLTSATAVPGSRRAAANGFPPAWPSQRSSTTQAPTG